MARLSRRRGRRAATSTKWAGGWNSSATAWLPATANHDRAERDGEILHASVLARLLGIRLLRLDAEVMWRPAYTHRGDVSLDGMWRPTGARLASTAERPTTGLDDAMTMLRQASWDLAAARRRGP
jgi:hypothetical protein